MGIVKEADIASKKERIKANAPGRLRALRPLAEAGALQEEQKQFFSKLADETWYDF